MERLYKGFRIRIFKFGRCLLNLGVADFGYDFYLLAIAKLLHGQYFRLLDFYFHTLIQQRLNLFSFCWTISS